MSCVDSMNSPNDGMSLKLTEIFVPSLLKFLMTNVKAMINSHLTQENYLIWKSQITKLLSANGSNGYLDNKTPKPRSK